MTRVVTVVQARTGSTRLPGKVLLPLGGKTILEQMLARVRRARLCGTVVVATTYEPADDAIEALARRVAVCCYRGDPLDLLDRHYQVGRALDADLVVKIPSDCPLIDPAIIDRVIGSCLDGHGRYDYLSNLHPPTHPDGNDVEVCTFEALATAWRVAREPSDREHTTPFFWRHPEAFRIGNMMWETGLDLSCTHRIVLDYAEDYEVIRRVFDALSARVPDFGVADIVSFLDEHPEIVALNARYRGSHWYRRPGVTHSTGVPV